MSISVKAFLVSSDGKPEIRRFPIESSVTKSYSAFVEKLVSVFPGIRQKNIVTYWKGSNIGHNGWDDMDSMYINEEGDEIVVSSDEELKYMFDVSKAEVIKIYVRVVPNQATDNEGVEQGDLHPNVVCDGCNGEIRGCRYKCLQCPDYDLCSGCETKGTHNGHNMLRIVSPSQTPYYYGRHKWWMGGRGHHGCGRRHGHHQRHRSKEETPCDGNQETNGAEYQPHYFFERFMSALSGAGMAEGGNEGTQEPRNTGGQDLLRNIGETVAAMLDPLASNEKLELVETTKGKPAAIHHGYKYRIKKTKQDTRYWECMESGCKGRLKTSPKEISASGCHNHLPDEGKIEIDKCITRCRRRARTEMTPLSEVYSQEFSKIVDAGLDWVAKTPRFSSLRSPLYRLRKKAHFHHCHHSGRSSRCWTRHNDGIDVTVDVEHKGQTERCGEKDKPETESKAPEDKPGPSTAGIDTETGIAEDAPKTPEHNKEKERTQEGKSTPDTHMDVDDWTLIANGETLPERPDNTNQAKTDAQTEHTLPSAQLHPDPKISKSLEHMLSMGFNNDGGWLTHLLELKDGDIGKVLDVLQPVKQMT